MMGELAIRATENFFKGKKTSRFNEVIINLSKTQIKSSIDYLKSEAILLCNLDASPNVTLNYSLASPVLPSHRQWLSNVTRDLSSFIKSGMPGRERLSVAIGIAKMVKKEHHYSSFTEPLIDAITALFNHLEFQSRIDLSLIHFTAFQEVFVRMCSKAIEITKLTSFGPQFSTWSFSQLLTAKDLKLLANQLNHTSLSNTPSFRKQRIIRRLINHSQFVTRMIKLKSNGCIGKTWNCECNSRKVTLLIPKIVSKAQCLSKVNNNRYIDRMGFTYLSDGAFAITATKYWQSLGDIDGIGTTKILQQPIVKMKNGVKGWLVSRNSVYLPENINTSISILCVRGKEYLSFVLQIDSPGLLRIFENCNYTTQTGIFSVTTTSSLMINTTFKTSLDALRNSSFSHIDDTLSPVMRKLLEKKFQNALSGEDNFQISLEELKNQSWLKGWINMILDAAMPAAITFITCLAAAIAVYIGCCCCPKNCNLCRKTTNNNDIVARVEKLEHFFTFYVNDRFHELQRKDLLEATKNDS